MYTLDASPDPNSVDTRELLHFVVQELNKVAAASALSAQGRRDLLGAEPSRPREGQLVYADGVGWDPGQGAGTYQFDGTNWLLVPTEELELWTPSVTFATPGDVSFTPTLAVGELVKQGSRVDATFRLAGTITHTTAAGNLQVTGLPYTPAAIPNMLWDGALIWGGITLAGGRTQVCCALVNGSPTFLFSASGSGVAPSNVDTTQVPTGGTLILRGNIRFRV